jgi:hypothetical protein
MERDDRSQIELVRPASKRFVVSQQMNDVDPTHSGEARRQPNSARVGITPEQKRNESRQPDTQASIRIRAHAESNADDRQAQKEHEQSDGMTGENRQGGQIVEYWSGPQEALCNSGQRQTRSPALAKDVEVHRAEQR